ncbi:MAG: tat pathway signal sequence domain protein [Hyphomicrobiaceae bacterium]
MKHRSALRSLAARARAGSLALCAVFAASVGLFVVHAPDAAAKPRINTIGLRGVAIKGYDPVAYFNKRAPTRGSKKYTVKHAGATWRFANAANKAAFAANPSKYVPAYGGYCAYGVSQGYLVKIEPTAWAIRGGKLYLNYDRSIQRRWSRKPASYIATANKKWPRLLAK